MNGFGLMLEGKVASRHQTLDPKKLNELRKHGKEFVAAFSKKGIITPL